VTSAPRPLAENAGLAFTGEAAWMPAQLSEREARRILGLANACGRPNADVLRRRLAVVDGTPVESWSIDFPEHFTMQEAALYEEPFALLCRHYAQVGISPHLNPALRRALARVSRWLAMPADADAPDWRWIEDEVLPDASLIAVARDDDYTHGVLASPAFALWHAAHRLLLPPEEVVASFPFPWPPSRPLGSLDKLQEEQRHAIARAARAGEPEALHAAVLAAYGWPPDQPAGALLTRLTVLHQTRSI
jgi:hypothetical protein